jgi:pyruvate/2-oxoglutarate dehydrogenase complex dihydrolipoamide acyltransferase (E2) component
MKAQQVQMAQQMQQAQQAGQPPQPMPQLPQLPPLPKDAIAAEEVLALLRNERMRPFILQTASDSTIQPNEDAEKQRRNEFAQAVGNLMVSSGPIVQAAPEAAKLVAEMLRFVTGAYRAGRAMEQTIDDFIEELSAKASQPPAPPPPDPKLEAMKMDAQMRQQEAEMQAQIKQGEAQMKAQEAQAMMQVKVMEAQARMAEIQAKAQHDQAMAQMNERIKNMDLQLKGMDLQLAEMRIMEAQTKRPVEVVT